MPLTAVNHLHIEMMVRKYVHKVYNCICIAGINLFVYTCLGGSINGGYPKMDALQLTIPLK